MNTGYIKALQVLFNYLQESIDSKTDKNQIQSIKEGIEYLCLPFRDDVDSSIVHKMHSPFVDPKGGTNVFDIFDTLDKSQKNEITKKYFLLSQEVKETLKKLEALKV